MENNISKQVFEIQSDLRLPFEPYDIGTFRLSYLIMMIIYLTNECLIKMT